ncbi:MAG: hypothetical protein HY711_03785, partial [Candidatus Melainabacteria bacterium]|nr:hypothetical protein [Candidatus Melainabacteria bacterium]
MGEGRDSQRYKLDSNGLGYGDVAPKLNQEVYQRAQSQGDWPSGYSEVAPEVIPPGNVPADGTPGQNTDANNDDKPVRSGLPVVAPGFPGGKGGGTGGGGTGPSGSETKPEWDPRIPAGIDPKRPWERDKQPGSGGGRGDAAAERERQRWREENNFGHFAKLELIGGTSGALWGGPFAHWASNGAKWYLARSDDMLGWAKTTKEAGAPAEGAWAKSQYAVARVAEKPLTAGQLAAKWWEENHGIRTGYRPEASLQRKESEVAGKLHDMAKKLEPRIAEINKAVESRGLASLTVEERAMLSVNEFLHNPWQDNGMLRNLPQGADKVLNAEELAVVQRFQTAAHGMRPLGEHIQNGNLQRLVGALEAEAATGSAVEAILQRLEPRVQQLTARISAPGAMALTADEQAIVDAHKYFKDGLKGTQPANLAQALTGPEMAAVGNHRVNVMNLEALQPDRLLNGMSVDQFKKLFLEYGEAATKVEQMVDRLAPEVQRIVSKARDVLTAEEKNILARYECLTGKSGRPLAGVLTAEEEALLAQRASLKGRIESLQTSGPAPSMTALRAAESNVATQVDAIVKGLQPDVDRITQKLASGGTVGLTAEEQAIVAKYNYLKGTGERPPVGVLTAEEEALLARRAMVKGRVAELESELAATPRGWGAFVKNFAKGMMVIAGVQFVEDKADRLIFGKDHAIKPSWYTDSLLMPASLLMPGGWLKKGGAMLVTHLFGKWLDHELPAGKYPQYTKILRPNGVEAAAVAGAFLLPMRAETFKKRAAYLGIAWAGSKLTNLVIENATPQEIADGAIDLWKQDKTERSASSMIKAIDEFKKLAKAEAGSVERYRDDWIKRARAGEVQDKIIGHRGAAILLAAVGETQLEMGTQMSSLNGQPTSSWLERLSPFSNKGREYDYILAGKDIDLGGHAMANLAMARKVIDETKKYEETLLQSDPNATCRGTQVRRSEIDDLEVVGKRVDKDLERIYGRHDIAGIYQLLKETVRPADTKDVDTYIKEPLRKKIGDGGTSDPRYLAKLHRDLALVTLAQAGTKVGQENDYSMGLPADNPAYMY